ncbi:MAG: phage major capsid protein [Lachnospiraceae bacterium]|nr:phage major capsid protein [Lachnospiraceae bacterium]
MNREEYLKKRNELLEAAQAAIEAGDSETYEAKAKEVEDLDAKFEKSAQQQADLNALKGAVKPPVAMASESVVSKDGNDKELEYRMAFMNYVMKGTPIMKNTDEVTTTSEVGAVIPQTVLNRIVEKIEKVGNILNLVTRTYYKGGVVVPTSSAKPTASWVAERGDVDSQEKTTGSVTFAYNKLKVKVAVSLEVSVVTLDIFERTLINQLSEAIARALDSAIINGRGTTTYHEPEGILKSSNLISGQNVNVTEENAITYANLIGMEALLPEGYDDAIYVMNKKTFVSQVLGMVDDNGQPIARIDSGIDGKPAYTLFGRHVEFTTQVAAYIGGTVTADTIVAFLFRMKDYMLNTNMQPTVKKYTDEDTDDEVTKCIMLADGKVIDNNSLVTLTVKNS